MPAPPGARIVYIDGAFDLFHPGHVEILKVKTPTLTLCGWHACAQDKQVGPLHMAAKQLRHT